MRQRLLTDTQRHTDKDKDTHAHTHRHSTGTAQAQHACAGTHALEVRAAYDRYITAVEKLRRWERLELTQ